MPRVTFQAGDPYYISRRQREEWLSRWKLEVGRQQECAANVVAFIQCNTIKWPILTFFGYCFVTLMLFFLISRGAFAPLMRTFGAGCVHVEPLLHHAGCHTALLNVLSAITASPLASIYTLCIYTYVLCALITQFGYGVALFCVFILGGCGLPFLTNTHGSMVTLLSRPAHKHEALITASKIQLLQ